MYGPIKVPRKSSHILLMVPNEEKSRLSRIDFIVSIIRTLASSITLFNSTRSFAHTPATFMILAEKSLCCADFDCISYTSWYVKNAIHSPNIWATTRSSSPGCSGADQRRLKRATSVPSPTVGGKFASHRARCELHRAGFHGVTEPLDPHSAVGTPIRSRLQEPCPTNL